MEQEPVDLFYSYAHEDEPLRDELERHLKIMERRGVIRSWHDRSIVPGQQWNQEIDAQLAAADLILLLVSADFINSDYIWGHELETAMKRNASAYFRVAAICRICSGVCSPASGVPGIRYLPMASGPITTGS